MIRMHRPFSLAILLLAAMLVGCSDDDSSRDDDGDLLGDGVVVNGRLMGDRTLVGTVADDHALTWTRLCAQDIVEGELFPLCSSTDDDGGYRMLGLFHRRGLLETSFTDRFGEDHTWYSLYDLGAFNTAVRSNLNATTDLLTRAYIPATLGLGATPAQCFDDPDCAATLNSSGLNEELLNLLKDNLGELLGPFWPQGARPFTGPYTLSMFMGDDLPSMHRRLRYYYTAIDGEPGVRVEFWPTCNGQDPLTEFTLAELALWDLPEEDDLRLRRLTDADLADSVGCQSPGTPPPQPFTLNVDTTPTAGGDAPLDLDVRLTAPGSQDAVYEGYLINPRGQTRNIWSGADFSTTLTNPGQYRVVGRAFANGEEVWAGTIITVSGGFEDLSATTWGQTGSCRPNINSYPNVCLERLDGTVEQPPLTSNHCTVLTERPDWQYSVGICSTSEQYGGALIGVCLQLEQEVRILHYDNNNLAETTTQQHNRERSRCDLNGGFWLSLL
ncbi:hypothetical protein E4656_06735 [Natronospirillum operosum]|uniref:Uncharacterized protein n=1 Tax=Natronospirillum operosum TaxID=2759953 RepID=A0A4Z0WFF0_9GAMM|nr:hypothetical protein [Natronospirillum operosum]TGG93881.1 hypothetical protein E4656_06735 [Natronospirillum operosum]